MAIPHAKIRKKKKRLRQQPNERGINQTRQKAKFQSKKVAQAPKILAPKLSLKYGGLKILP